MIERSRRGCRACELFWQVQLPIRMNGVIT
jgi:hypothetical protein